MKEIVMKIKRMDEEDGVGEERKKILFFCFEGDLNRQKSLF